MIRENLEVFDPEHPPIYYYMTKGFKRPSRNFGNCQRIRKPLRGSSKLMIIFACLYVVYLFYLAIEKPQFALDYAADRNRQTLFSKQHIKVSGSLSILPFQDQGVIQLTLENLQNIPKQIHIKATYSMNPEDSEEHLLAFPSQISLKPREHISLPVKISLDEDRNHKSLQTAKLTLELDSTKRTLLIKEL